MASSTMWTVDWYALAGKVNSEQVIFDRRESRHDLDIIQRPWSFVQDFAPLYLRTLWRYTNAVIIIIAKFVDDDDDLSF